MATNYTCINKIRDNKGKIVTYVMRDDSGNVFNVTTEQIKANMKLKHFNFTNLQIDKAGRLVDKVDMQDLMFKEFEKASCKLVQGEEIEFGFIERGNKFFTISSGHKVDKVIEEDEVLIEKYMTEILEKFEQYIMKKGINPYKLHFKSKDGAVEVITFGLYSASFSLVGDRKGCKDDLVKKYLGSNKNYYDPQNYAVRAYRLNNPNQLINDIYIAPDLSLIKLGNKDNSGIEMAYNMLLQGKDIGFGCVEYKGKAWDLMSDKAVRQALKEDGITEIPIKIAPKFESYISSRGIQNVYCLHVRSKDGKIDMKNYCLNQCEILLKGFIGRYAGGSKYYIDPNNYVIEAYIVGKPNQPINDIFIAPDLRTVKVPGGTQEPRMTRRDFLNEMVNSFKNYFK